jgi:copper chaperone CopZ
MVTTAYKVTGMSCEHCVKAVTSELGNLSGVSDVKVDLVPSGVSLVTVTSDERLADDAIGAALDEAGDYRVMAG